MKNCSFCLTVQGLLLLSSIVKAQTNSTGLKGEYLGQKPPGMHAEIFAQGIVSTDAYEHSAAVFSPDGKTLLWTVVHMNKPSYLLEMKLENGEWTKPAKPSFTDTTADDIYPSFSVDGRKLYFSSRRKLPDGYPPNKGIMIWEVEKTTTGWGSASPFDTSVSKGIDYAHSMTKDGTIYFSVSGQGGTNWNIWYSKKIANKYQPPELLPYNINGIAYDDGPFIAPDGSYLIFESERPEGIEGSIDLYICFREQDDTWSAPENMGDKVNSKFTERFARVSPDGKYLFFGSDRRRSPSSVGADIYWIDAKVIKELKDHHDSKNRIDNRIGVELLLALDNNDNEKAAGMLKQWLVNRPKDIGALVDYCAALRNSKQYETAEMILKSKLTEWPDDINLQTELVLDMIAQNKREESAKYISSSIPGDAKKRSVYVKLATHELMSNNNKESALYFEKALAIEPVGFDYYRMAYAYTRNDEKDKAIDALEKSIRYGFGSKQQFEGDPNFRSLRTEERFKILLEKLK